MDRQTVYDYIKKKYKAVPEYPWRKYPGHAVFRHKDTILINKIGCRIYAA